MFGLAGWSAAYAIQVVGSKHGVVLFCFYEIYFIANKSVLDQKIIYLESAFDAKSNDV